MAHLGRREQTDGLEASVMDVNVSLSDDLALYVEAKIATGRCTSSSEFVHEALRSVKVERQDAAHLQSLRTAWEEGLDSGDAGEIDLAALKVKARGRRATPTERQGSGSPDPSEAWGCARPLRPSGDEGLDRGGPDP